jgi:putative oxidoreductase
MAAVRMADDLRPMLTDLIALPPIERWRGFGALFVRLAVGAHLIFGVQDNIRSADRMTEFAGFLSAHDFPVPELAAPISVYFQFVCGLCFVLGAFTRLAAVPMIVNFVIAIAMVHLPRGDGWPATFPAVMMLCGSAFFLLYGAGRASVDEWLVRRAARRLAERPPLALARPSSARARQG